MTLDDALRLLGKRLTCVASRKRRAFVSVSAACWRKTYRLRDVPPHDNSAVDGYALRFDDLLPGEETRLRIAGRAAAGHPFAGTPGNGEAVRIFTGAPMPAGCDTVMMQEDCVAEGEHVRLRPGLKRGANRRRAGEDVQAGTIVLRQGARLRPQDLGLAAAVEARPAPRTAAATRRGVLHRRRAVRAGRTTTLRGIYDSNRPVMIGLLDARLSGQRSRHPQGRPCGHPGGWRARPASTT